MPPSQETENLAPVLGALAARGYAVESTAPMPGDVSRRTYHRLTLASGAPAVLAVYPADLRDACRRSLATGRLLAARGVRVARELDHDCQAGWVLLEDLGPRTLYEEAHRPWSELAAFFEDAVRCIGRIATLAPAEVAALNPPLDGDLLRRELAQTREVFLAPLGLLDGRLADELAEAFERLCARLTGGGLVPCHRDLGARNLMPLEEAGRPSVGVLDHQDLRLGPPGYDLASLLNDSLFPPAALAERLLALAGQAEPAGRTAYHRAAAQRTLKAVGSYAAFARRGSGRHLPLIPPTLRRAVEHLRHTPETRHLASRLEAAWAGVLRGDGLDRLLPADSPGESARLR
jgi:hypothetical protein